MTRWLQGEELDSWKAFSRMLLVLPGMLDAQLQRDAGLTFFNYLVLAMLSEAPNGQYRMSELAEQSNGSLSRLSHAVSTLERRGWVERSACPGNGRVTMASLTEAGRAKLVETAPGHVEAVRALVLDRLTPAEFLQLGSFAARISPTEPCGDDCVE